MARPDLNGEEDVVIPFFTERAGATGRIARLGTLVDGILKAHDYPEPVSRALGEALTLTVMLGVSLKFEGKLILQTSTDGPLDLIVVDYETPGKIRGYAHYHEARLQQAEAEGPIDAGKLIGKGHLALTIDHTSDRERTQGIVALDGHSLTEAAQTYFRQSEQLPTFIHLAIAKHYLAEGNRQQDPWHWRAGGLMVQKLTPKGGHQGPEKEAGEALELVGEEDEDWRRTRLLAGTVEDHELLDPLLSSEGLLFRLFHEETVRVFPPHPLKAECHCSPETIETLLSSFTTEDIRDMAKEGQIEVVCKFCNKNYQFEAAKFLNS